MKELEDTSPANEAEGQNSRTKLLENGHSSETSTARESSTDVDVDDVAHEAWFQKVSGERRSLTRTT